MNETTNKTIILVGTFSVLGTLLVLIVILTRATVRKYYASLLDLAVR